MSKHVDVEDHIAHNSTLTEVFCFEIRNQGSQ